MRLRFSSSFHRTLSFRLTAWYSGIFIVSSLVLLSVSYLFVFSTMRDQRGAIQVRLREYAALVESGGVPALESKLREQRNPSRRNSFFARITNQGNTTIFVGNQRLWEKFDFTNPQKALLIDQWQYYSSKRDGDLLEVLSVRLANDNVLQVGKRIREGEEVLERFRDTMLATIIPMVLFGVAGGAFLAFRALRPIRHLSSAARSIVDTARFDARVAERETGDELNELVILFNQMLAKIETVIGGMKDALDNVAHDLRTPITRLRGMAEQALRSNASPEICREALADCLEESDRVMAILNSLMDISEAETGTMKLAFEDVNLAELIHEVTDLYEHVADEAQVRVTTDVPPGLSLRADRTRLRQVVANLVDNAIKYTPSGGQVEIAATRAEREVLLLVRDSGIGIPADELPRIWDRLYRGDKSRSQRGLGLGLSLVKAVVQAHQGRVEAASDPGGGSVFSLSLPLPPAA
jgi:signal transduction histidine kinase